MDNHCKTNIIIQSRKIEWNEKINQSKKCEFMIHSIEKKMLFDPVSCSGLNTVKTFIISIIYLHYHCQNKNVPNLLNQTRAVHK